MLAMQAVPTKKRVAIVGSDPATVKNLTSLAYNLDAEVVAFDNAHSFLDKAPSLNADCLLIAASLPDDQGVNVIRQLKSRHLDIPSIMLAQKSQVADAVAAMQAGCLDFVEAPFVDRLMLDKIQKAINLSDLHH